MDLANLRRSYEQGELRRSDLAADPIEQFEQWFAFAEDSGKIHEANAMTLATVDGDGQPLQRTVLLKGVDERGFVFYSNYRSRKAQHIADNAQVSLLFPWIELERQVIVRGTVKKVSREETAAYFATRPRISQLGAWVSDQSSEIDSRETLEKNLAALEAKFDGQDVPVPDFWGGYRIAPTTVEFWQGGKGRLHDRFEFRRENEAWSAVRLSP